MFSWNVFHMVAIYIHMFTNFGGFILIFSEMASIFQVLLIVVVIWSFEFHQVKVPMINDS